MITIDSIFIFFLSLFLLFKFTKNLQINKKLILFLIIYRTIICLSYIPIAEYGDLDAFGYYKFADKLHPDFYNTNFIFNLNYIFKNYLSLSIVSSSLIFTFIGTLGIIFFILNLIKISKNIDTSLKNLCQLVVFLPTLNLWTSCIGKDAITFLCINLLLYAFLKLKPNFLLIILSSLFFILVRPYVGITLVFSLVIAFTGKMNLPKATKFILVLLSIGGLLVINLIVPDTFKFDNLSNLPEKISFYQIVNATGNNIVDLEKLNFPLKLFTFMFRPLFLDAKGAFAFLMSFENIIYLLIFIFPVIQIAKSLKFKKLKLDSLTLVIGIFLGVNWTFFSMTCANLGTANRYKLMFVPGLIFLSIKLSERTLLFNKRNYLN